MKKKNKDIGILLRLKKKLTEFKIWYLEIL